MKRNSILIILIVCVPYFSGCWAMDSEPELIYLIPETFEGAVVVIYDREDGMLPRYEGNKYFISIPPSGIVKIKPNIGRFKRIPKFFSVGKNNDERKVEYLFRRVPPNLTNARSSIDITDHERDYERFAMVYDSKSFNTTSGRVIVKSFLVCKVVDANRVASNDLLEKLEHVRNSLGE